MSNQPSSLTLEIRREVLGGLLALVVLAGLAGGGYVVSPRAADGRPLLLLPEARAVEQYRQAARGWARAWRGLAGVLSAIRVAPEMGLLAQSQKAQEAFTLAVTLARAVEGAAAPPALVGLQEQATLTAQAYVDLSVAVNRWLSAPSAANRAAAEQAEKLAAGRLAELEANAWLGLPGEATAPAAGAP